MGKLSYKLSRISSLNSPDSRLFQLYQKEKTTFDTIKALARELENKKINSDDVTKIIQKREQLESIPISIFNNALSPLEALCQYLIDNLHNNFHDIGVLLKRDERTIWTTYRNAKAKHVVLNVSSNITVPVFLFASIKNSVLEILAHYLKQNGHSNHNIAVLIGRNDRTIWTVLSRYNKKNEQK